MASLVSNTSIDTETSCRIGEVFVRLSKWVWDNPKLTVCWKSDVYLACIYSTLLYDSETRILLMCSRKKLTFFTNHTFVVFSELGGNKLLPMKKWLDVLLVSPLCTSPSVSIGFLSARECVKKKIFFRRLKKRTK